MSQECGLWAFDLCKVYPLPDNKVLVRNPRNGKHAVLMPDVYNVLLDCRMFRSLDEHARHLATVNAGLKGQEHSIREVLDQVRKDGLLLSAEIYPHLISPNPAAKAPGDPAVAAVVTWERPEALSRCLESTLHNCDLERIERFYVIDDSRSPDAQQKNRNSTEDFAARAPMPVSYIGPDEQQQFMQRIIRQLPAHEEAIRFLIDRERWAPYWTSGLGRTLALMLSVGKRLLVLDDDILCEVFEPHVQSGAICFSNAGREAAFYQADDEWQALRADSHTDPISRHLSLLGLGLADSLGALGVGGLQEDDLAGAPIEFLEKLRTDSPVLITECGSLSDPGTAKSNWLTGLEGESLERLLASDESVENALTIRNCWNGRSRTHFGPTANMSPMTGLDNRHMLPPYIPIMRGEDRLFGSMVTFLFPGSVTVDNAWAIPHLPIPARRWTDENRAFRIHEPFPNFILSMISDHSDTSNSRDPMRRQARLARMWEDLADMNHEQLRDHYLDKRLAARARQLCHLKMLREECEGAPSAWLDYLDQALERLNRKIIDNPVDFRLTGYPKDLEDERLTAWWQAFANQFAHAIRSWPAIRQAARQCMP